MKGFIVLEPNGLKGWMVVVVADFTEGIAMRTANPNKNEKIMYESVNAILAGAIDQIQIGDFEVTELAKKKHPDKFNDAMNRLTVAMMHRTRRYSTARQESKVQRIIQFDEGRDHVGSEELSGQKVS